MFSSEEASVLRASRKAEGQGNTGKPALEVPRMLLVQKELSNALQLSIPPVVRPKDAGLRQRSRLEVQKQDQTLKILALSENHCTT